MATTDQDASLPAPLSLTLDQAREVAGGSFSVANLHPWYWYGQPVAPWVMVNPISVVSLPAVQIAAH